MPEAITLAIISQTYGNGDEALAGLLSITIFCGRGMAVARPCSLVSAGRPILATGGNRGYGPGDRL